MGALCEDLQEFHEGGVAALRMSPQMEVTLDSRKVRIHLKGPAEF